VGSLKKLTNFHQVPGRGAGNNQILGVICVQVSEIKMHAIAASSNLDTEQFLHNIIGTMTKFIFFYALQT